MLPSRCGGMRRPGAFGSAPDVFAGAAVGLPPAPSPVASARVRAAWPNACVGAAWSAAGLCSRKSSGSCVAALPGATPYDAEDLRRVLRFGFACSARLEPLSTSPPSVRCMLSFFFEARGGMLRIGILEAMKQHRSKTETRTQREGNRPDTGRGRRAVVLLSCGYRLALVASTGVACPGCAPR